MPRVLRDFVCSYCARPFTSRCLAPRFCSGRCSGVATLPSKPERTCPACAVTYLGHGMACSTQCYRWARKYPGTLVATTCGYCDGPISDRTRRALYCSQNCAVMVTIGRRRANRNGQPIHRIRPTDIFERDGWLCHLCAEPIDRTQRDKQPGAPALDHIIAIAHPDYPGHIAANLAAAHWSCNTAKGNRVTLEDFELYHRLLAELPPGVPVKRRPWMGPGPNTHCVDGHEYTKANTYWRPDGVGRQCKECIRRRGVAQRIAEDPTLRTARLMALRAARPARLRSFALKGQVTLFD